MARYTTDGVYDWAKQLNTTFFGRGNRIAVESGHLYLTGQFYGEIDVDPDPGVVVSLSGNTGNADILVAKYTTAGVYVWAHSLGSLNFDTESRSIGVDASGNCYVTGELAGATSFNPPTNTTVVSTSGFLAKYTSAGALDWVNGLDVRNPDVATDAVGNSFLTGSFRNTVDVDPSAGVTSLTSAGSSDIFITQYGPTGNLIRAQQIGSSGSDIGVAIALDLSGNTYLTGVFSNTVDFDPSVAGTANLSVASGVGFFIAKYNAAGDYVRARKINLLTEILSLAADGNQNAYLAGGFLGTANFDPDANPANPGSSLTAVGQFDGFLAKYGACNAIIHVTESGSGLQDGSSWANSYPGTMLQTAINTAASCGGGQVWVAAGTYKPTTTAGPSSRTISFSMRNNVAIYGGFVGSETALSGRPALNPVTGQPSSSTLSGEIGNSNNLTDNSLHVISNPAGLTTTAVLDGFVITGGRADGISSNNSSGGGIYNNGSGAGQVCSPLIRNCSFQNNTASIRGGAMANEGSDSGNSSPSLTNCSFQNNTASILGGAMANNGFDSGTSSPSLTNCAFQNNNAAVGGAMANEGGGVGTSSPSLTNCAFQSNTASNLGGAIYNVGSSSGNSSPSLTNCSFQSNTASSAGGAIYNTGVFSGTSSPSLTNCAFQSNTATVGGAIYNEGSDSGTSSPSLTNCAFQNNNATFGGAMLNAGASSGNSSPSLTNCVLWGNGGTNTFLNGSATITAAYSLFEPASATVVGVNITGPGNLTTSVSPFASTTSTQLAPCSPAINAGDPATTSATVGNTDLAGNTRFYQGGRIDMGAYEFQEASTLSVGITPAPALTVTTGQTVTLTASGATSYSWSSGQSTSAISVTAGGTYSVTGTTGGCSGVSSVTVTANAPICYSVVYVTQNGAGLQNGSSWANSYPGTMLQTAINTAASCGGGQVLVARGLYKPTSTTDRTASFSILSGVTVRGGYAADGAPGTRTAFPSSSTLTGVLSGTARSYHVVQFYEVSVGTTLDGFVITGGNADDSSFPDNLGGGILSLAENAASSPTLSNLVVTQNRASGDGGGVLASGELHSLTMTNALIQSNTAISSGGGIEFNRGSSHLSSLSLIANTAEFGGGIAMGNSHTLTGANVLFQGNTATGTGFGGGLYSNAISNLNSVTFTANSSEKGGGIYITEASSSLTMTNSLLQNNTATIGGGLHAFGRSSGSSSRLTSLSVIANQANIGGGIYIADLHSLTATNSLFQNNTATATGGGIWIGQAQSLLVNSLWQGNVAAVSGGAASVEGNSGSLTLVNATLYNNTAPAGAVLVTSFNGQARLINSVGWGNGAPANTFTGGGIQASYSLFETGTTSFTDGGNNRMASPSPFVDAPNGNLRLNACALAINAGDPISATGNSPYSVSSLPATDLAGNARIVDGRVDMGAYEFSGGPCISCNAIIHVSESGSGLQDGSSWANAAPGIQLQLAINTAASCGGGQVWVAAGTYKPTSTTDRTASFSMQNNVAIYGGFLGSETALSGRPALNPVTGQPSSSTLSGEIGNPASLTDNSQTIVYHPEGLSLNSTAVLDGFVLTRGNGGPGGGMQNETGNNPTVRNCLFIENVGGGMHNLGSSPTVTNCSFQSNTTSLGGGGIYNEDGSSPSLTNCLFERNEAEQGGGVWNYNNSNPTLTNCIFRYNLGVSGTGGGLYNQDNSNATVTNCVFLSNTAIGGGGGISNLGGSSVTITNCILTNNTTPDNGIGGGIRHEDTDLTLTNCLFRANSAGSGGGVYTYKSSLRIVNTSFERNSSGDYGGAISADGSTTLTNCSFQSNSANVGNNGGTDYGAIIQRAATFVNCVEFGNQTGKAFTDPITANYSLFAPSSYTEVAISGSNNLTAIVSPFASTTSAVLYACSPAIDAGDPATMSAIVGNTDLAGNARFVNTRIDMGAYESAGTSLAISASTATPVVCQDDRIQFTGSGGGTYRWSGPQSLTRSGSSFSLSDVQPNQSGTYTLVVTDANSCTASTTVSVTINPAPATPAIARSVGGDVCGGSSVTLSVAPNPNVTYAWQRGMVASEERIFTPFGSGTAITATQGGIYRVIATSTQTSCSVAASTALFLGDYRYVGSIDANDPTQQGRFDRDGDPSTCAIPKPFSFDSDPNIRYDAYTIVNPRSVPVCAVIGTRQPQSCDYQIQSAAYLGSFNPASVSANYAGDGGATWDEPGFYEITIPANGTAIVVVHGSGPSATCSSYTLVVDIPREAAGLTVSPASGTVCPGTSLTLTASVANTYAWNTGHTTKTISTTPTATTAYAVTLGYGNVGCTASASTTVFSNTAPTAGLVASGTITCAVPTATLTASGGGNYSFSGPGIVSVSGNLATVNVGGPYSVTVTGANGCFATNTVSVSSDLGGASAVPTLSASSSVVCVGANVRVVATVSGSPSGLQWYRNGSLVAGQTSATLSLGGVQVPQAGSYVLVVSGVCSVTSAPFSLTVNPLPTVTLSFPTGSTVVGPGTGVGTITLPDPLPAGFDLSFGVFGGVRYERVIIIDRINGFEIRQVDSSTGRFAITRTGPFTITATDANGCRQTVQGVITNLPTIR